MVNGTMKKLLIIFLQTLPKSLYNGQCGGGREAVTSLFPTIPHPYMMVIITISVSL